MPWPCLILAPPKIRPYNHTMTLPMFFSQGGLLAVAMLAVYFGVASRPAFTLASLLLIWFWLLPLPFSLFIPGAETWTDPLNALARLVGLGHPEIAGSVEMFFVSGLSVTAAATLLVIFNVDNSGSCKRRLSSTAGSFGFSTNRTMRLLSSPSRIPKPVASLRLTGIVAMVISAPVTMCCVTTSSKLMRYNWSPERITR